MPAKHNWYERTQQVVENTKIGRKERVIFGRSEPDTGLLRMAQCAMPAPNKSRYNCCSMVLRAISIPALFSILCFPAAAQWLHYPTPGLPKTPGGAPKLNAPAPRTADRKPDLSGLWAAEKRPCPPDGCIDQMVGEQFIDIGFGIQGGLPLQPWAAELKKKRTAENGKDDPTSRCLPGSPVQMHTSPFLRKIVQVPGLLVMMSENSAIYRQIFTDNRALPERPLALLVRILLRQMGRRHTGRPHDRLPRRTVARSQRVLR